MECLLLRVVNYLCGLHANLSINYPLAMYCESDLVAS